MSLLDQRQEPGPEGPPIRVLLISDGRPGHFRQSEGVVAAIERRRPVVLDRLELVPRVPLSKGLVTRLGRLLPPAQYLSFLYGLDAGQLEKPDMIVSTAGTTIGANVSLARIWGIPNVFCGSTRGYSLKRFHLVLTPYASVARPPKIVAGPKPGPFDPEGIPPPRPVRNLEDFRGARVSLLIGGPTPYCRFGDQDWVRLAALVEALVAQWGCSVTIVTSRRTPDEAYESLMPLAERPGGGVSVIDYRSAGPGSIEASFDCDLILVTSDSMSMMTEAALSRRPAIALAPRKVRSHRDDEAVDGLVAAKWLRVLPLETTDAAALVEAAVALEPSAQNYLDPLADLVLGATGLRTPA